MLPSKLTIIGLMTWLVSTVASVSVFVDSKDILELLAERIVTAKEALYRRCKMSSLIGHAIDRHSRCALS